MPDKLLHETLGEFRASLKAIMVSQKAILDFLSASSSVIKSIQERQAMIEEKLNKILMEDEIT